MTSSINTFFANNLSLIILIDILIFSTLYLLGNFEIIGEEAIFIVPFLITIFAFPILLLIWITQSGVKQMEEIVKEEVEMFSTKELVN